jgi:hypothetical protein
VYFNIFLFPVILMIFAMICFVSFNFFPRVQSLFYRIHILCPSTPWFIPWIVNLCSLCSHDLFHELTLYSPCTFNLFHHLNLCSLYSRDLFRGR